MNKSLPLHYIITENIRDELKQGKWKEGDLFPTDKQLMEKYEVSSTTIRRALNELVLEGWIERKAGKGTFVKNGMVEILKGLTGFFEEIKAKNMTPSAIVLKAEVINLNETLTGENSKLKEFESEQIVHIKKIQKMNGSAVAYLDSFWDLEIGKKILEYDLSIIGIYEIVQNIIGVKLEKGDQTISAAKADSEIANALNLDINEPLLVMDRIVTNGEKVLEISSTRYRSDKYSYRIELKNEDQGYGLIINGDKKPIY